MFDDTVVVTAIEFAKSEVRVASTGLNDEGDSYRSGLRLGKELVGENFSTVFVLSDGTHVNGSELVRGIVEIVGNEIPVTGGMAGDGDRFGTTLVGVDDVPRERRIAAFGIYGPSIVVGHGSIGGWTVFGPERRITHSKGNVLYELDHKPALDLYKKYLGEAAKDLPGSALLFPLQIRSADAAEGVVRTVVAIDEAERSMTFAGNVPEGFVAKLMRGNLENLIDGAAEAARMAIAGSADKDTLCVMVSCIGRKLLLGQRIAEEVEAVRDVVGDEVSKVGFYSYGEISPHSETGMCELHNQTMTVTVLSES